MVDLQRNKRVLQTYNSVKRQQKRRLTSISYYSKTKNHYFGSLLQIIKLWQKQIKNKKLTNPTGLEIIANRPKSQQCYHIVFPELKQDDLVQKPNNLVKNVFRVRINSHCQKLKSNCNKNPEKQKIKQLNVFAKTISEKATQDKQVPLKTRSKRQQKSRNLYREQNEKWCLNQRPASPKYIKIQKQYFQQDFSVTPWQ